MPKYALLPSLIPYSSTPDDQYVVFGTFQSGVDSVASLVVADIFAPGSKVTDLDTGITYKNVGTTAVPDFQAEEIDTLETEVTLTSAQILALNTTPIALLAAPGAGKFLVIENIVGYNEYGTTTYAFDGALEIRYTDASGAKVTADFAELAFAEAAAAAYQVAAPATVVPVANAAIVAYAAGASDPTTGDGDFRFNIKYRVVSFA